MSHLDLLPIMLHSVTQVSTTSPGIGVLGLSYYKSTTTSLIDDSLIIRWNLPQSEESFGKQVVCILQTSFTNTGASVVAKHSGNVLHVLLQHEFALEGISKTFPVSCGRGT